MRSLFQTIADRLRGVFVAALALGCEAPLRSRQADRRAELLVQAEQHDRHGFPTVAAQLRHQAEALSLDRPLHGGLPGLEDWRADPPPTPAAPDPASEPAPAPPMPHPIPTHNGTTGPNPDGGAKLPPTRRRSR